MPGSGRRKDDTRRAARGLRAGAARQKRRRQHMFEVHEGCMRRKTCEHEERREKMRPTGKRRRGQGERRTEATTGDGRRGGSEGVRHSYQLRPRSSRDTTSENGQWNAAIGAQGDITWAGKCGRSMACGTGTESVVGGRRARAAAPGSSDNGPWHVPGQTVRGEHCAKHSRGRCPSPASAGRSGK